MTVVATEAKHTERTMLRLIENRLSKTSGNGPEWAFVPHVRNESGFNASRTLDAVALSLWPSRGHELHGFEVKVSRADFRRELADGAKAEAFIERLDRFWIVAPKGIVPKEELPHGWGLLESKGPHPVEGDVLKAVVQPVLQEATDARRLISRSWLVCLLRAAKALPGADPAEVAKAREDGYRKGVEQGKRGTRDYQALYEREAETLQVANAALNEFQEVLGVSLSVYRGNHDRVKEVADALRVVLADTQVAERAKREIETAASRLEQQARWMREEAGKW